MDLNNIEYTDESILIVDDDEEINTVLEKILNNLGFSVRSVLGGEDALKALKDMAFTFLLTDMRMPNMGGMELIKRVSSDFPDVNIIAMTGYSEGYRYIDVLNSGASDFIKKPFESGELEEGEYEGQAVYWPPDLEIDLESNIVGISLRFPLNHPEGAASRAVSKKGIHKEMIFVKQEDLIGKTKLKYVPLWRVPITEKKLFKRGLFKLIPLPTLKRKPTQVLWSSFR